MIVTGATDIAPVTIVRELALAAGFAGALRVAVKLGLADVLGDEPAPVERLAPLVDAEPELLRHDALCGMNYMVMWATEPWTLAGVAEAGRGRANWPERLPRPAR
ncbi:MAG: hypothetical protein ACRDRW_11810 [Pseudonocardiaceae bacterium]